MAFVASQTQTVFVPSGGGQVAVTIPRMSDAGGNGSSWPMFSHCAMVSTATSGVGLKLSILSGAAVYAIKPDQLTVSVQQDATNFVAVLFGKSD